MIQTGNIIAIDGFRVNERYLLIDGYYKGNVVLLKWIARNKQLCSNGQRYRQVRCLVLSQKKFINTQLNFLSPIKPETKKPSIDFSKINNLMVIKLARLGNKKAIQEYVRRFRKLPKINK